MELTGFSLHSVKHEDSLFTPSLISGSEAAFSLEEQLGVNLEQRLPVFQDLNGQPKLDQLLRSLPGQLRQYLSFDYMSMVVRKEAGEGRLWYALQDHAPSTLTCTPLVPCEEPLMSWVVERQEAAVIATIEEETRLSSVKRSFKERGLKSVCAAPLTTTHCQVGAILIGNAETDSYSEESARFFSVIADQIAAAVDNVLSHAELKREKARLKLLLELTGQVVSNLELQDVVRAVMTTARSLVQSDGACVFLEAPDSRELRVYALDFPGCEKALHEGASITSEGTITGRVFKTGQLWAGTVEEARAFFPEPHPVLLTAGFKTGCMLPILGRSRTLGTLGLVRNQGTSYSQDELGFLRQVASQMAIAVENAFAYQEIKELKERLAQETVYLQDEIRSEINFEEIVGQSAALRRVLNQVETVAPTGSTVLICGETGTGKELIARAIHNLSPRHSNAFVKLNCAAIPTGLLESELFGHEKGAFTGAVVQRIGRFELANRGTVFLDEVGEIPLELQTKLLRVLQEREFERLGSTRTIQTDARLIAATNRDLPEMVEEQKFRSDLFYRLNVFPVRVPSLRERPEDIPLLVRHFVQHFARRMNRAIETIPSDTMSALIRYQWPGNIRELQNLIERAVILSPGPVLRVPLQDLPARTIAGLDKGNPQTLEEAERAHILATLKDTKWVIAGPNGAAARLGMNRSTVQFRMKKHGIVRPSK
jgi:formate hydrogenlyase transcriptional activator